MPTGTWETGEMEHKWKSQRAGGPPDVADSYETVTYCENCGGEYPGDPAEFPEHQFPCAADDTK